MIRVGYAKTSVMPGRECAVNLDRPDVTLCGRPVLFLTSSGRTLSRPTNLHKTCADLLDKAGQDMVAGVDGLCPDCGGPAPLTTAGYVAGHEPWTVAAGGLLRRVAGVRCGGEGASPEPGDEPDGVA